MLRPAGNIYGYARVSRDDDGDVATSKAAAERKAQADKKRLEDSLDQQITAIQEYAVRVFGGEIPRERIGIDSGVSCEAVAFHERPGFVRIAKDLDRGDHLVLWSLDRLEGDMFRTIEVANIFHKQGITLHTIQDGREGWDFDTMDAKSHLLIRALVNEYRIDLIRKATKRKMNHLRSIGRDYCGSPGYGRVFRYTDEMTKRGKPVKWIVWDRKQCDLIRELVYRRDVLEQGFTEIGRDFDQRGEPGPNNCETWLRYPKEKTTNSHSPSFATLWYVYRWYKLIRSLGMDLGEDGCNGGTNYLIEKYGVSEEDAVKAMSGTQKFRSRHNNALPRHSANTEVTERKRHKERARKKRIHAAQRRKKWRPFTGGLPENDYIVE